MIETEQQVVIDVPIDQVWDYVRDIKRWADLMPGLRECQIIDDHDSRWTLKVGVGALVRTVNVAVHVDRWNGPGEVDFTYRLDGDPVDGGGTYTAVALNPHQTEVRLQVRVVGTGAMAPMWEAMGAPLLPKFAKGFAEQLKNAIEEWASADSVAAPPAPAELDAPAANASRSSSRGIPGWLRRLWGKLFAKRGNVTFDRG